MPARVHFALSFLAFNLFLAAFTPAHEIKSQVRILYTGKLFGYYYAVDTGDAGFTNCPNSESSFSPPATAFLNDLNSLSSNSQRLLVGTGDNFAPEIEARIFTNPPPDPQSKTNPPHEKELYSWDYISGHDQWILNRDVSGDLYKDMLAGKSFIRADNVACFLRHAHYDAVVPGKHDFHFGPERLRLLARVLASPPTDSNFYTPVQMLGTNLVIKTSWASDHEPIPRVFIPGKLGKQFYRTVPPKLAAVKLSISNGKSVYPWLQFVTVIGKKLPEGTHAYLWDVSGKDPFVPQVPQCPGAASCNELPVNDKGIWFNLPEHWHKGEHFSVLKPGRDYSLCLTDTPVLDDSKDVGISCTWFSVFEPFFLYPSTRPTQGTGIDKCKGQGPSPDDHCYTDPEPFVWKESKFPNGSPSDEVVIFGVVDPAMQQHVGEWNALWMDIKGRHLASHKPDDRRDLRTSVSFEEPLEALSQIVQYFDRKYCLDHPQPGQSQNVGDIDTGCRNGTGTRFIGSRILLAEMPPPQALSLSVYINKQSDILGNFDALISGADDDFATRDQFRLTSPFDENSPPQDKKSGIAPAFLAVPPQAWPWAKKSKSPIRSLQVLTFTSLDEEAFIVGNSRQQAPDWKNTLGTFTKRTPLYMDKRRPDESVDLLKKRLAGLQPASNAGCLRTISPKVKTDPKNGSTVLDEDSVNNLVLCAMQQKTHADIAMIQERDVYWPVLNNPETTASDTQLLLDAVLWKGDFVVVLAVPGSTLQKIFKESADFGRKDRDNLSLEREFGRGLLTLGIVKDEDRGEYIVNDVPLDPGKLYTVATTDYIATGDTGYQELASVVGSEKPQPQYENRPLQYISAVVCQAVEVATKCDPDVIPDEYFDQFAGNVPADPRPGNIISQRIKQWSALPSQGKDPFRHSKTVEANVQNRHVWSLSLDKFNVGYGALYHSFSETNLNNFFSGVQATEVTAPRNVNWTADEKLSLTHSYRLFDLFSAQDLNYVAKFTATNTGPSKVNQSANILDFDNGVYWHRKGRHVPHYDFTTVFHIETQAFAPIVPLNLTPTVAGGPKTRNFELGRTWTMLARTGPRYNNRHSYVEGGVEAGRDLNAIRDFQFVDALGAPIGAPCFPTANNPLQTCVSKIPAVTTASGLQVFRQNRAKTGVFWHSLFSIPFVPKVTESIENQGDFFFNNAGDNSTDTRLRHLLTNKLSFQVYSNLSFSPTYQVLFYENKVDNRWLWQQQAMVTVDFSFDLTNFLVHKTELEYKVPPPK